MALRVVGSGTGENQIVSLRNATSDQNNLTLYHE